MITPIDTIEDYKRALETHDWTYVYSDDHRYYMRGLEEDAAIQQAAKLFDPGRELYRQVAKRKGVL